jgi:hypothetical protein
VIAVIRVLRRGGKEPEALVTIPGPRENSFYWWFGPSWNTEPYEIVYTYPGGIDEDAITLHFYKTFGVPVPVSLYTQSAGWIAPDGKWFTCRGWEHDSLAKNLAAIHYDSLSGVLKLEEMGWLRVYDDGLVANRPVRTQAQLDTLHDLLLCGEDAEWQHNLDTAIELAKEEL